MELFDGFDRIPIMARPLREDFPGAVHHVYDRGNTGQAIFRDDRDRQEFLRRLIRYGGQADMTVLSQCLMTTHFHLVPQTGPTPLSEFMHLLLTSYTRYFNDRWLVRGHLFQGRFGARLCRTDREVRNAIRYTHLNPVNDGLVERPEQWPWSSHNGFLSGADPVADVAAALTWFNGAEGYIDFMNQPLSKNGRPSLEELARRFATAGEIAEMRGQSRAMDACEKRRRLIINAREFGYRNSEIGKYLGRGASAISMILQRLDRDVNFRA